MTYQPQNQNLITGVLTGIVVTLNADPTKYNISAGLIIVDDWSTPNEHRMKVLTYAGVTVQIPPNPTRAILTGAGKYCGMSFKCRVRFDIPHVLCGVPEIIYPDPFSSLVHTF